MIGLLLFFGVFPIGSMIIGYLVQRLRSRERLLAIEKGVPLPRANRLEGEKNFRLAGMICVAAGVGLLILFTSLAVSLLIPRAVIAVSAIPFLIGVAFLIEYRVRMRELKVRGGESVP